jgi:hypothetical protein
VKIPDFFNDPFSSNIFTTQENILLLWLEVNYEHETSIKNRLKNFNKVKDGHYLASVLKNYVGDFSFVGSSLANMKPVCQNNNDRAYNLRKILKVLKLINLQVPFTTP